MKQLAEQVGINYKTLNTLVNEDGRLMNPKQLALFSKYTGKSKQEVFYDNLKDDDLSDACTKTALLYIGKKTCEGWIAKYVFFNPFIFINGIYCRIIIFYLYWLFH